MNNPALPHGLDRRRPFRAPIATEKGASKIHLAKIPRNPLISLDSDERIQGNPRKSNAPNRDSCGETATRQENPNRRRTISRAAAGKEPEPASIERKAA